MDIRKIFRTDTPLEALKNNGIILTKMNERGRIYSCNTWHCEVCNKNNAYQIPVIFSSSAQKKGKLKSASAKWHYFCSETCEAAWVVNITCMPLTFKKKLWNATGEKILYLLGTNSWSIRQWWERNISQTALEASEVWRGRKEMIDLLKNGKDEAIDDFYVRYLDTTLLDEKLAREFPDGLWMISLTKDAPSPDFPYSIGARFLVKRPNILYFSESSTKNMRINPHPKLKTKRKIELIGSEIPRSLDWIILVDLPKNDPGLEIHIPTNKQIPVYIGIKKYVDLVNGKFVAVSDICDKKYLKKDLNGIPYMPYRLEFGWHPNDSSEECFNKQFDDFIEAARNFAEFHAMREYRELLAEGNFSQETLADIGLFIQNWKQWKEKHKVQK